jgi:hypothetical protein
VDDAASAQELPDEPAGEVAAAAGDAHYRLRRAAHPSSSLPSEINHVTVHSRAALNDKLR